MTRSTAPATTPRITREDQAEIAAVPARMIAAWPAHDGHAFGELWH